MNYANGAMLFLDNLCVLYLNLQKTNAIHAFYVFTYVITVFFNFKKIMIYIVPESVGYIFLVFGRCLSLKVPLFRPNKAKSSDTFCLRQRACSSFSSLLFQLLWSELFTQTQFPRIISLIVLYTTCTFMFVFEIIFFFSN